MSPAEITQSAQMADMPIAHRQVWQFVKAMTEPDFRPSDNAGRVVNFYFNSSLMGRYAYLAEQVRRRGGIEPDTLEEGQVLILINRSMRGFALITQQQHVTFHKLEDGEALTLESFEVLPKAFNQRAGLDFDPKLLEFLERAIEGRSEARKVRGGRELNPDLEKIQAVEK